MIFLGPVVANTIRAVLEGSRMVYLFDSGNLCTRLAGLDLVYILCCYFPPIFPFDHSSSASVAFWVVASLSESPLNYFWFIVVRQCAFSSEYA